MSIDDVEQLDELLSRPGSAAIGTLQRHAGDVVVLGAAGKMGPTLARMLQRAAQTAGSRRRVLAVSRFREPGSRDAFHRHGIETMAGDLADRNFVSTLPAAPHVFFLSGMKFGATGNEPLTWGMNAYVPALVAERYAGSRIVAFSTGNVYGLVPVASGGSKETDPLAPMGEYAMSCLARERMFQYFSERDRTPVALIRLNYAVELRYGVLVDLAERILRNEPVDLAMGYVNVIWQGDACDAIIGSLTDCSSPAHVLNVAGPQVLSVRRLAEQLAERLGMQAQFSGSERADALLNNAGLSHAKHGPPLVPVEQLLDWTADWVRRGGDRLGKPTHFESRSGRF